jgi:hypothetical protein
MIDKLKRTYFTLLVPAIVGFAAYFIAKTYDLVAFGPTKFQGILAPLLFILSVVFAIALPIFCRVLFANSVRQKKGVSEADLLKFERIFLYIALVTPYIALAGYMLELPRFHLGGTVIMALYAVYYYYPSQKRIQFERRIFRVK